MTIKLNANNPKIFNTCKISVNEERLYDHKFQGKPVNILALKKSDNARPPEKIIIETTFKFKKGPMKRVKREKNKLKNSGIKNKAKGIKSLKFSSKVNELVIQ